MIRLPFTLAAARLERKLETNLKYSYTELIVLLIPLVTAIQITLDCPARVEQALELELR
jgi:hypothetical protein